MMLESRALLDHGGLDGTGNPPSRAESSTVAAKHHVTVVSVDPSAALQLGWVLDILVEANRISPETRFTWDVLSLADYDGILRDGTHQRSQTMYDTHSAVFVAGERPQVVLNDLERERLRRSVRQLNLALACGPAVELFAACSLLQGHSAAACRTASVWMREQFPGTLFRGEPLCWNGRIGTSTGGVAVAAAMLELLARLGLSRLSREIGGRLLLPGLRVEQPGLSPRARFGARSSKIVKAISFMQENLEGPLSVHEVASHVGSSVRQLERLFNTEMQTTPARFLKRLRLEQAQALLLNTELSMIEIVCAAGFESPTHFSKAFRREFSVSPSKWRQERRSKISVKPAGRGGVAHSERPDADGKSLRSQSGAGAGLASCS